MSYVTAAPELMTSAAADLATIGSNVSAAHVAAAARTTSVIPAAADEVSTGIAQLFSAHAATYQAMAAQAAAFNDQFVQHLTAAAFSYTDIEAALASFLQNLQELPAFANGLISLIAAHPLPFLLGAIIVPPIVLFAALGIGVSIGLVSLFLLALQLTTLLASFGI